MRYDDSDNSLVINPPALPKLRTLSDSCSPLLQNDSAISASPQFELTTPTLGMNALGLFTPNQPVQHHRHRSSATSLSSSLFGTVTPSGSFSSVSGHGMNDSYYLSSCVNDPQTPPDCIPAPQPANSGPPLNDAWTPKYFTVDPSLLANGTVESHQCRRLCSFPQSQAERLRLDIDSLGAQFEGLAMNGSTPMKATTIARSSSSSTTNPSLTPNPAATSTPIRKTSSDLDNPSDVLSLAKDQHGCRYLQRRIDENYTRNFPVIFAAVVTYSAELMVDPFGNYLMQKLMSMSNSEQISMILLNMGPSIYTVSVNQHGTRACQKLIDSLSTPYQHRMLESYMVPHMIMMIQDLNGNHVVQKCIQKFQSADLQFIVDMLCSNMLAISTHKHGCCVLQKLMNKCSNEQVRQLGLQVLNNSIILMQDQFGNYVVQYLINMNLPEIDQELIRIVQPYIVGLSSQKFSSNVVEKCLKMRIYRCCVNPLLDELLIPSALNSLVKDRYGNYVVQTAIDVSPPEYKLWFAMALKPLLSQIRFASFGKRIQNKVTAILDDAERQSVYGLRMSDDSHPLMPGIQFERYS